MVNTLIQLIEEVYSIEKTQEKKEKTSNIYERYRILISLLKQNGFWPSIQVKWFHDKSGLVMMYNAYKNNEEVKEIPLYKETRSVIINLGAELPEDSIISSISKDVPVRMSNRCYKEQYQTGDILETGYEGTMIHVYHHNNKWYFSTTSCPNIDYSRYFHPTKTHGTMFDEILQKIFHSEIENIMRQDMSNEVDEVDEVRNDFAEETMEGEEEVVMGETIGEIMDTEISIEYGMDQEQTRNTKTKKMSKMLRDHFVKYLETTESYLFVLVHHENKHLIDYSHQFGANYKELFHISTQFMGVEESISKNPYSYLGIHYPHRFVDVQTAMAWLESSPLNYAVIVKRDYNTMLKVCNEHIIFHEENNLGNANPWHNMLWIFLKNRPDFTVSDYIKDKKYTPIVAASGKVLSPTFVIHNTISTITSYIYDLYRKSTYYNLNTKELIFNGKLDKTHAPIMRFHMVQLRNIQKKYHTDRLLSVKIVADYMRYHQTMKNIRMLIAHFAKNPIVGLNTEYQFCIEKLNTMLTDRV
jgi:hypothetical protein